jgi:SAM-dependent methyltransferase
LKQQAADPRRDVSTSQAERLFSGPIGTEYQMLDLICPVAAAMSKRVGLFVLPADAAKRPVSLRVFEIGCGTRATTLALLESREDIVIQAADNEPAMLDQARGNLSQPIGQGRVRLIEADALAVTVPLVDSCGRWKTSKNQWKFPIYLLWTVAKGLQRC